MTRLPALVLLLVPGTAWAQAIVRPGVSPDTPGAIHTPLWSGQLPGWRGTTFLGEGLVGPDHLPYMVFLNPADPQLTEVQLFDNGSQSPIFRHDVPSGRSEQTWLHAAHVYAQTMRAWSATVRWELGGSVHLTSWRVPPFTGTMAQWIRSWTAELVSPSWDV